MMEVILVIISAVIALVIGRRLTASKGLAKRADDLRELTIALDDPDKVELLARERVAQLEKEIADVEEADVRSDANDAADWIRDRYGAGGS